MTDRANEAPAESCIFFTPSHYDPWFAHLSRQGTAAMVCTFICALKIIFLKMVK